MGRMYPAAHKRFMKLSLDTKLTVFSDILNFFEYIASQKYIAIVFYDESILYDFESGKTTICDIDFFHKQPCINDMGRMWGSSLFQEPEEYEIGAALVGTDEIEINWMTLCTACGLYPD